MTDNEKLARWQGWTDFWTGNTAFMGLPPLNAIHEEIPDYLNDGSAAMSLLDTLVSKGYTYTLEESEHGVIFVVSKVKWSDTARSDYVLPRREAVVSAVLELIWKEDV